MPQGKLIVLESDAVADKKTSTLQKILCALFLHSLMAEGKSTNGRPSSLLEARKSARTCDAPSPALSAPPLSLR